LDGAWLLPAEQLSLTAAGLLAGPHPIMNITIIKTNGAHSGVLDRAGSTKMAAFFADAIDLLKELVDYGTNLTLRAFHDTGRGLAPVCVLFVQLRQFLTLRAAATFRCSTSAGTLSR